MVVSKPTGIGTGTGRVVATMAPIGSLAARVVLQKKVPTHAEFSIQLQLLQRSTRGNRRKCSRNRYRPRNECTHKHPNSSTTRSGSACHQCPNWSRNEYSTTPIHQPGGVGMLVTNAPIGLEMSTVATTPINQLGMLVTNAPIGVETSTAATTPIHRPGGVGTLVTNAPIEVETSTVATTPIHRAGGVGMLVTNAPIGVETSTVATTPINRPGVGMLVTNAPIGVQMSTVTTIPQGGVQATQTTGVAVPAAGPYMNVHRLNQHQGRGRGWRTIQKCPLNPECKYPTTNITSSANQLGFDNIFYKK